MMKRQQILNSASDLLKTTTLALKGSPGLKPKLSKLWTLKFLKGLINASISGSISGSIGSSIIGLIVLTFELASAEISLAPANTASAAPPQAALVCSACHGANGISNNPTWPNLAGQKKDYLESQIAAFKKGDRKNQLMSPIASMINDADIPVLAEYFSKLSGSK